MLRLQVLARKAPVWKSTDFDAGLYDIAGFFRTDIISINHQLSNIDAKHNILFLSFTFPNEDCQEETAAMIFYRK